MLLHGLTPCICPGCLCQLVEPSSLPTPCQAQHIQERPRCEHAACFCPWRYTACWGKAKWEKKSGKLLSQRASENACAKNRNLLTLLDMTYVVKTSSNAEKGHASPRDFICQCLTGVWPLHPPKPWVEEQDWLYSSLSISYIDHRKKYLGIAWEKPWRWDHKECRKLLKKTSFCCIEIST